GAALGVEALEGGDLTSRDALDRGDARDAGLPVDQDRAATALALRAAPVLGRAQAQLVPQDVEERRPVVGDLDRPPVDVELDQLNDEPHPQVRDAFGLLMANAASVRPSL